PKSRYIAATSASWLANASCTITTKPQKPANTPCQNPALGTSVTALVHRRRRRRSFANAKRHDRRAVAAIRELAARGIDVVAARCPQVGRKTEPLALCLERVDHGGRRSLIRRFGMRVPRNDVDLALEAAQQLRELSGVAQRIVYAREQHVLERDPATLFER